MIDSCATPGIGPVTSTAIAGRLNMAARLALGDTSIVTGDTTGAGNRTVIHAQIGPTRITMAGVAIVTRRGMTLRQVLQMATIATIGNARVIVSSAGPGPVSMAASAVIGSCRMVTALARSDSTVMTGNAGGGYADMAEARKAPCAGPMTICAIVTARNVTSWFGTRLDQPARRVTALTLPGRTAKNPLDMTGFAFDSLVRARKRKSGLEVIEVLSRGGGDRSDREGGKANGQ